MNKKGTIKKSGEIIVWLVFLLMVIVIFLGASYKIKNNNLHNTRVEAREFSFVIDAISSSSAKVHYIFRQNPNITINMNENCQIQAKHKDTVSPVFFRCGKDLFSGIKIQQLENKILITK